MNVIRGIGDNRAVYIRRDPIHKTEIFKRRSHVAQVHFFASVCSFSFFSFFFSYFILDLSFVFILLFIFITS